MDDINMVYAMDGKDAIQIILRRDVKGIKVRDPARRCRLPELKLGR